MVRICAAINCSRRSVKGDKLSFHAFPIHDTALCEQWVTATKRVFEPTAHHFLCSHHFKKSDYKFLNFSGEYSRHLKDDAVPSIFRSSATSANFTKTRTERKTLRKRPLQTPSPTTPTNEDAGLSLIYSQM